MNTSKRHRLFGGALLICALIISGIIGTAIAQTGDSYCEIELLKCPYDYDGDTLVVPLDVVALSAGLRACNIADTAQLAAGVAPSIMFVIDQSASMYQNSGSFSATPGFDMEGNRYKVTSAILEHIYKEAPDAEIGMVIFAGELVLNRNDDNNLVRLSQTGTGNLGAYMPLVKLNATDLDRTGVFGNDSSHSNRSVLTGYDVLQNIVKTTDRVGSYTSGRGESQVTVEVPFTDLAYVTNPDASPLSCRDRTGECYTSGTNITEAFDAAKAAMATATAPKENQYIIFISDGEATAQGSQSNTERDRYQRGVDVPTTFTIYLDVTGRIPASINTMTENIRGNGYSDSNEPMTDVWQMASDYSALLDFMQENIMSKVLAQASSGAPRRVTITSANVKDSSENVGGFTFRRRLPFDTTEVTPVRMDITYKVTVEEIEGGEVVGTRDVDSTITYQFHVRRTEDYESDWAQAQGLKEPVNCRPKPTLSLLHNNIAVDTVKGSMNTLTVRLDNTNGLFDYGPTVSVLVFNLPDEFSPGGIRDTVALTLTRSGNIYSANFPRTVSDVQVSNGTLEHMSLDSIIAVFRNPEIPLDTSRVGALYLSHTMAFYNDQPSKNPADSIVGNTVTAIAGEDFPIYSVLVNSDGALETWGGSFNPENVTWTVSGGRGDELKGGNKGDNTVFYTETANQTYSVTAVYREGDMEVKRTLDIVVKPGAPEYLQVVFEEAATKVLVVDPRVLTINKEFEFKSDMTNATFYVVERDRFGNLIMDENGNSGAGSAWASNNTGTISTNPSDIANSALVTRIGKDYAGGLQVIVTKNGLADTVNISLLGDAAVAIGPNPFVPGISKPIDMFADHPTVLETYRPIIEGPSANSNPGVTGPAKTGILVAVSAPSSVNLQDGQPSVGPGGHNNGGALRYAQATVIIYDAVGNVVWRSKPNNIILADDNVTYGFVWDGRNEKGRVVAPGTYLVRMVGQMSNGEKFSSQRKVGVRKDGSVK